MTTWLKYTRTALLIGAVCLGGLAFGSGCNKGDDGEDRGVSARRRNQDRFREPIRDRPVEGEQGPQRD